ncbi:MAG: hypothetical protein HRU20_19530 [Pseudomonadales bacterium]|nr:hypothetical protein [Pseudomonadales bacterium]
MKKNNNKSEQMNREKDRASIANQVQAFLEKGGEIEVLGSAFDKPNDPKCRLGEEMGLFV